MCIQLKSNWKFFIVKNNNYNNIYKIKRTFKCLFACFIYKIKKTSGAILDYYFDINQIAEKITKLTSIFIEI